MHACLPACESASSSSSNSSVAKCGCLAGEAMVSGCWSTTESGSGSGLNCLGHGQGEFKANNAVNFKRRIPSINVNTRFINLHTKHTHARRATERQGQRKRECEWNRDRLTTQLSLLCAPYSGLAKAGQGSASGGLVLPQIVF